MKESHAHLFSRDNKSLFYIIIEEKSRGVLFYEYKNIPKLESIEMINYWRHHFSN